MARKILHIGAISVCAFAVYLIPDRDLLLWIVMAAVPGLGYVVWSGFFSDPITKRRSWGIFYFAVVYMVLLFFFRNSRPELVYYPMLVLALSDGLATVVGEKFGKYKYRLSSDSRTVEGSVTFFLSTLICLGLGHLPLTINRPFEIFVLIIFVSIFLTLTEALSSKGRDNLWVPLGLGYWMLVSEDVDIGIIVMLLFLFIPAAAAYWAFKAGWLQAGGAIAALLLGWIMLLSPEPIWILPTLFFFVVGSILTKLPGKLKKSDFGNRSVIQVFSNGLFPALSLMLYFLFLSDAFLLGYCGGIAAALSDTSSSEIGTRLRHRTYNVINGHPVSPGLSGGVSWSGLLAGLVFSMMLAGIVMAISSRFDMAFFAVIAGVGFAGNLLDSVFGSWFQVKYQAVDSVEWQDQLPGTADFRVKGLHWVTNDVVNLISTGCTTLFGILLYNLL